MLHIDLDSLEMSRMNSYLREVKHDSRQSSAEAAPKEEEEEEEEEEARSESCREVPAQLAALLSKLDLADSSDEDDLDKCVPKTGDHGPNRRESYEKLRHRNEEKARELNFRFMESGFDGGLFLGGVTLSKLEEGLRHLRRVKRFLDVVKQVERQMLSQGLSIQPAIGVRPSAASGTVSGFQPSGHQWPPQPHQQASPLFPPAGPQQTAPEQACLLESSATFAPQSGFGGQPAANLGYSSFGGQPAANHGYSSFSGQSAANLGYSSFSGQPAANPGYSGFSGQPAANPGYSGDFSGQPAANPGYSGFSGQPAANPGYANFSGQSTANPGYSGDFSGQSAANPGYSGDFSGQPAANPGYSVDFSGQPASNPGYSGDFSGLDLELLEALGCCSDETR